MPTLLEFNGLRFFFYSNESNEPIHVHIVKGDAHGKVWLEPSIEINYLEGFTPSEKKKIMTVIQKHSENFKAKWKGTSANKSFDSIEYIILTIGLRIKAIDIHPELDLMTIYLSTHAVLTHNLSSYPLLKGAESNHLLDYEIIGGGTGVHWPSLDEDLSLKGFLQYELLKVVKKPTDPVAA